MRHAYGKIKALQQIFNGVKVKKDKDVNTIQVLQKDLKLARESRTAAENSTCLNSDSFEINTDKSLLYESDLVAQVIKNVFFGV